MTNDEFLFWEKAFLALLSTEFITIDTAEMGANNALAVWRAKRAEVEREHVGKVVTNDG